MMARNSFLVTKVSPVMPVGHHLLGAPELLPGMAL